MYQDDDQLKMAAAESAVGLLKGGMIVGLGSGSTASFAIRELGRRVKEGLRILGVPTSDRTAVQARALGIPISSLSAAPNIDITIDGADQVEEGSLNLIKGHGGALLREKIVAGASGKLVIMVHDRKLVKRLSGTLPIEVVPFGWEVTARHLSNMGIKPSLRRNQDDQPFQSDGGNYILDCTFESGSAAQLDRDLDHIVGLVEHGLFIGLTSEVHVAGSDGVRVLLRANV
jgi:ribose 5-phosphate isomerase A